MKSLVIATAFAFATMTSVGMAGERAPQKLTVVQMEQVTAGGHTDLVDIQVGNVEVLSRNDIDANVAIPVAAAVAANILAVDSTAISDATNPGRIGQRN